MQTSLRRYAVQRPLLVALFSLGFVLLLAELVLVLPRMLRAWQPFDYLNYMQMGQAVLQGRDPAGPFGYYPLPTAIWLFAPLALLPDWFRLIWTLIPFASLLHLFGRRALMLFLFAPLWVALGQGAMDAQLLIPIAWLMLDGLVLAPIGAVLLLLKPQLAALAVAYMVVRWVATRQWRKVGIFLAGIAILTIPAFVFEPAWPLRFLQMLPLRTTENFDVMPLMTSSLWSWWNLDNPLRIAAVGLLLAAGLLFVRAIRQETNRPAALIALGLLLGPIFYSSSVVAILPALRTMKQIAIVTGLSLLAFAVDQAAGTFGGFYALLPLAVLWFACVDRTSTSRREDESISRKPTAMDACHGQ
jgi:hypothetical protein